MADYIDETELAASKAIQARDLRIQIQFWVVVALMVLSFVAKSYREDICNSFNEDPINTRLEEIKQRYQFN